MPSASQIQFCDSHSMISLLTRDVDVSSGGFGQRADARSAGFIIGAASARPVPSLYTPNGYMSSTPAGYRMVLAALFGFVQTSPWCITLASRHGERQDGDTESVHEHLANGR